MNLEAKMMCLEVLHRLLERKKLNTQKKLAKALNIPLARAKDLLDTAENHTQDEIIKYTAVVIHYNQEG